jgi:hypothetical protein
VTDGTDDGRGASVTRFVCGAIVVLLILPAHAQVDRILKGLGSVAKSAALSDSKVVSGLKEALQIGTENSVNATSKPDGFFRDAAIKILMPDQLRTVERGLRAAGMGAPVDELVLGMNRAAEAAAPQAKRIFLDALKQMTFDDARKILTGGDTAATEYFKGRTSNSLATAFRPAVDAAMRQVGVARQYEQLMGRAKLIPFLKPETVDLNGYVVGKALDGLFVVLGREEQNIRRNPAARITPLLRDVFGAGGR